MRFVCGSGERGSTAPTETQLLHPTGWTGLEEDTEPQTVPDTFFSESCIVRKSAKKSNS